MSKVAEFFEQTVATKIAENSETALSIGEIFQFDITGDDGGTWTINVKEGPSCSKGPNDDATCIVHIADEDFLGMISGQINGMELFSTGKLTIERDMMAAMKLEQILKL